MSFYVRATITYFLCYLYVRLWICRLLNDHKAIKRRVLIGSDILTLALPASLFFRADLPYLFKLFLQGAGYSWAAIIACMVPIGLCFEPIRWGVKILGNGITVPKRKIFAVLCLISAVMTMGGYINATSPIVKELEFDLSNGRSCAKEYRIVAFSDLHVGKLMGRERVSSLVDMINRLHPEMVFMVGDVLDDWDAEFSGSIDELGRIEAPLGKYAVLGNHEYYLGYDWSREHLTRQGIKVLSDDSIVIDNQFLLVGRNDFAAPRRNGHRVELPNIIPAGNDLPVVLLDHTPRNLEEAQKSGVELQLSGHTHNGQLFPFNLIVERIYEEEYGLYKKDDTLYYISCGVGFWGPPLRTNSRPELLLIKLKI